MSKRPRWGQVRQFCEQQSYRESRTDRHRYDKVLQDGSVSRTMVSFGSDGEQVPSQLWIRVWTHQLRLATEEQFWQGLDGSPVQYDIPPTVVPAQPLPSYLLHHLRDVLQYTDEQIAATSRDAAQELLNAYHARTLREPP